MDTNALEIVRDIYAAYGRGDLDGILAGFSDQVVWETGYPAGTPLSGPFSGHRGIVRLVQTLAESLDFHGYEPREMVAQGDTVVVLGWERVTARATGRTYENPWVHVWTVADGKVVRVRGFNDTAAVARAFAVANAGP